MLRDTHIPVVGVSGRGIPDCVTTEGVTTEGVTTEGVTTEGVATEGVTTEGVTAEGVTADGRAADTRSVVPAAAASASDQGQAGLDAAWLERLNSAQTGDTEAVGELIDQVRDYLLLVARRDLDGSLQAKVSASDLVQQTMLEAGRDLRSFHGQTSAELNSWLVRILRHNLTDVARHYRGTQCRDIGREIDGLCETGAPLVSDQRSASSICRRVEADAQLDRAVFRLPEQYRRVIHLRHVQDLSWNEVAKQLNISAEAARKLWARTLAKLREELARDHETINESTRQQPIRRQPARRQSD